MVRPKKPRDFDRVVHVGTDVDEYTADVFGQLRTHFGSRKDALVACINLMANELSEGVIRCAKCRGKADIGVDVTFGETEWRLCNYCNNDPKGVKDWMVLEIKKGLR